MSRKWMLLASAGLGLIASPVFAQQSAAADADSAGLGDIVVTAQKREQNVQDVPVAVTVVGAAALENVGGSQLQDLTKLSPGLTITQGDQPGNNSIIMRGVGTFAFSVGVEPSTLVVIDDVAVGLQAQGFGDLADIERIEVLRGPQSTLFGKAASAGVISITTKAPSRTFTANGDVMITDDDEQRYSVGVSGPIGDSLSFRANATIGRYDGNIRELETGRWINGRNSESYRVKLLFSPSANFDATLIGYYNKADQDCCASVAIARTPGSANAFGVPYARTFNGITPGPDNFKVRIDPIPTANSNDRGVSLKMNIGLGDHTLTTISAWRKYHLRDNTDFDGAFGPFTIPVPPFGAAAAYFGGAVQPLGLTQFGTFDSKTFSQEIRLVSPSGSPLEYLLGAYFAFTDNHRRFTRVSFVQQGDWDARTSSDAVSAFGQATYEIVPGTRLLGGLRWGREDIHFAYRRLLTTPQPAFFASDSSADSVVTGKAGIQQDIGSDVMLFATYSRGYKGAAYDVTSGFTSPTGPQRLPVRPETSDAYEIGMKGTFLDRRLIFNVSAFQADYKNFQAQTLGPNLGDPFILANVGSVRTKGVEAELLARPFEGFQLNGSLAYTDAKIRRFPLGECFTGQTPAEGCFIVPGTGVNGIPARTAQDLSGKRLANAPKWKFNVGADWKVPLGSLPVDGLFNVNYSWQSEVNYALNRGPRTFQDSYGIVNASIGFAESENDRVKLTFFVRNLFNKHYFTVITDNTNVLAGNAPYPAPPANIFANGIPARDSNRYFGVRLAVQY